MRSAFVCGESIGPPLGTAGYYMNVCWPPSVLLLLHDDAAHWPLARCVELCVSILICLFLLIFAPSFMACYNNLSSGRPLSVVKDLVNNTY